MPLWAKIYVVVFLLFTVSNMGYYLYIKTRLLLVSYDLLCGVFFMLVMVSYWRPLLKDNLSPPVALIFFALLGLEFYLSTMGGYGKLGLKMPEGMDESDLDRACAMSILFASPAYIVGGLSMLDMLVK